MRTLCCASLLLSILAGIASSHTFLANSSHYVGGLNFERLPPIIKFAHEKSSIAIDCSATNSNAKVSWIKERDPVNIPFTVLQSGSLYIDQARLSDEGSFRCMLTSNEGVTIASHAVSIKVANSDNFWEVASSFNVTTAERSVVRLPCPVTKNDAPPPYGYKLSWTKSYKDIETNKRLILLDNGALIIKNTQISDSGIYRCKATFGRGAIESLGYTVTISSDFSDNYIKEPEEHKNFLPPTPPLLVLNTLMVVNAVEGHSAVLECITNDLSLDIYQWQRADEKPMVGDVEIVAGGSLYFRHVTNEDSGVYKCSSSSVKLVRPVRLIVLRPPEVSFSRPDSVASGPHVRFNCTAAGMPQPSIEILKDGLPLQKDFNYDIKGPTHSRPNTVTYGLHISYTWRKDEGTYQCIARNKAGVASEVLVLKIGQRKLVPPPSSVSVKNFTSSSIHYQWQAPKGRAGSAEFEGYIVYFFPTDRKENVTELVLRGTDFDKEYSDLLPDKNYTFIIRVFQIQQNYTHISEPVHVYQKTKAERPRMGPDVLFALRQDSIYVRWLPVSYKAAGGNITKQKIQWKKEGDVAYNEKSLDPTVTEFVIEERDPSSIYFIRVLLSSSAGFSNLHQNWIEVRAKTRPSPRLEEWHNSLDIGMCLKSNKYSNILVTWHYIPNLDNESFDIRIDSSSEIKMFKVQAFQQRLLVEQLQGGCYNVNLTGASAYSQFVKGHALICTKMPEKEVTSLKYRLYSSKAIGFTSDTISINWVPNSYKYFIIEVSSVEFLEKSYEAAIDYSSENPILYTHDNAPYQVFETYVLIVTCQSANLTLLYPATTYRIRIIAATEHLKGIPSSPLFVTTHEGVPSSPINYDVEVLTTSSVNVTWQPPVESNGYLIRYEVSYSSDKAAWKTAITSENAHSVVLKGLLSNTYYYVRIVASTRIGSGQVLDGVIFIPAELRQSISPHMIAVCVISVFVLSTSIILTYLCTKMFRMRKASSQGERDNSSSNTFNDHSSVDRRKGQAEDQAMFESNPSLQQFSNNVDMPRNDFKHYGISGCKNYVPSKYKDSSLTLLQNNDPNSSK